MRGDDQWGKKRTGFQPIIHRLKRAVPYFEQMLMSGELKNKFKTPDNMTIVTCHNYQELPLLERNLQFLGLTYTVLKDQRDPFKYIYKIEQMVSFLNNSQKTEYVLFLDALDTIVIDDPKKMIDIFEEKQCDLLFGSTLSKCGWLCMLDKRTWYIENVLHNAKYFRYLNSGVYLGRWDFTLEVLEEVLKYVHPDSLSNHDYIATGRGQRDYRLCKLLPNFPHGAPDQDILRFIHPQFYPRMKVDIKNDLVYRN